jgi:hypothetical protein
VFYICNLKAELEKMALMMETLMAEREQAVISEPIPIVVVSAVSDGTQQPIPTAVTSARPTQPLVVGFSSGDVYNQSFRPPGPPRDLLLSMRCRKVTHGVCHT